MTYFHGRLLQFVNLHIRASHRRSSSCLSSDSVGSIIKQPDTGKDMVGAWKPATSSILMTFQLLKQLSVTLTVCACVNRRCRWKIDPRQTNLNMYNRLFHVTKPYPPKIPRKTVNNFLIIKIARCQKWLISLCWKMGKMILYSGSDSVQQSQNLPDRHKSTKWKHYLISLAEVNMKLDVVFSYQLMLV